MKDALQWLILLALLVACSAGEEGSVGSVEGQSGEVQGTDAKTVPGSPRVGRAASEALRAAALEGRSEAVRQALDGGADASGPDAAGRTPLMMASFNGHTETVRVLFERGARVTDRDATGRTALMYASTGAFAETVELLLMSGADPNAADAGEIWTALMFAAGEGQMEVVQTLLRHGADPLRVDGDGDVAAEHAERKGHVDVARALREAAREAPSP